MLSKNKSIIFFIILSISVFVFEFIIMSFLPKFLNISGMMGNLLDAIFLLIIVVPLIYFLSYRPLINEIKISQEAQDNLRKLNLEFEYNVKTVLRTNRELTAKTKELEDLNKHMVGRELKMIELKKQINENKK